MQGFMKKFKKIIQKDFKIENFKKEINKINLDNIENKWVDWRENILNKKII